MSRVRKKPYRKPKIEQVKLVAKEAVLANCKEGTGLPAEGGCILQGDTACIETSRS